MKMFKRGLVQLCCLGWDLLAAWPVTLLVWALWGTDLRWEGGVLKARLKHGSFPVSTPHTATGFWKWWTRWPRGFYLFNRAAAYAGDEPPNPWYGTSLGNAQFFGPDDLAGPGEPWTKYMVHEAHHTVQARASAVRATIHTLVLGIPAVALGDPFGVTAAVLLWLLGGYPSMALGGWIAAWLGGHPLGFYGGSAHEIGAYAVGDLHEIRTGPKS